MRDAGGCSKRLRLEVVKSEDGGVGGKEERKPSNNVWGDFALEEVVKKAGVRNCWKGLQDVKKESRYYLTPAPCILDKLGDM